MTRTRRLVTIEGYSVEGGYDRPFGPSTCYAPSVALGRIDGPGLGDDLWRDYEAVLDFVAPLGVDGIRLGLEWARLEPRPGEVDEAAFARYEALMRRARGLGLWVSVVLVDGAWPLWCGLEAWILPWVERYFADHAGRVAQRFEGLIDSAVAFSDPEALVVGGYLEGSRPPFRHGALRDAEVARAQIARMSERARDALGSLLVERYRVVDADAVALEGAMSEGLDEVHLRSLVRGRGPLAARVGLLGRTGGQWRLSADAALFA